MAGAQTATQNDVRANILQARNSATQGARSLRPRPRSIPTLRRRGQRPNPTALKSQLGVTNVSEAQMYHEEISAEQQRTNEAEYARQMSQDRIHDYMRASTPLPAIIQEAATVSEDAVANDRMRNQYINAVEQDRKLPQQSPQRSLVQAQMNRAKQEASAVIEKKGKELAAKLTRNLLYGGAEVATEADFPGTVAWMAAIPGGTASLFSVAKTAVGIDKVFIDKEPPKLSLTDVSTWPIAYHAAMFLLVFGLAIYPIITLVIGIMGAAAMGVGLFAQFFGPLLEWTSWAASLVL